MKVTANATRSQGWWAVEVPEVDGAFTQARRLDQVPAMVRDAVALLEDIDEDSIEVDVVPEVEDELAEVLTLAKVQRAEAERFARSASELFAKAARILSVEQDLSLRDVGVILGMSHQRVAQILEPKPTQSLGRAIDQLEARLGNSESRSSKSSRESQSSGNARSSNKGAYVKNSVARSKTSLKG